MNKKIGISVIMPCFNAEKYLKKAIESVLNQEYTDFELIVVNDFSNDSSVQIVKELQKKDSRIVLIDNKYEKHNVSAVMNTGLDIATGKYLTRVDSDDIISPLKLKRQYEFLETNKNYILCSTNMYMINKNDKVLNRKKPICFPQNLEYKFLYMFENPLPAAPCMFINEIIQKNNLRFNLKYKTSEDHDFISRYLSYGEFSFIDEPLYYYRILNTSISHTSEEKTFKNSREICKRNVELFLGIKPNILHDYLTKYKKMGIQKVLEKNKLVDISDNMIDISIWAKELFEVFKNKYKISQVEQEKYKDYLNKEIMYYASNVNNQYFYMNCSKNIRKLYNLKLLFKKIINK